MVNALVSWEPLTLESKSKYLPGVYSDSIYVSFRLEIPSVSTVKVVMFAEIDQGFARDLLQELARAYSASSNTRTQVIIIFDRFCS